MKVLEKNVMRLVAVEHLRSAFGIKTKNWNKNKATSCKPTTSKSTQVFGVPLENLPYYNMECGRVPSFLVDACMKLLAHVDTEGLFRKSGSVVRLKALRAKLDAGEECLSTALPCDVAGLLKQFFRELPEPVLPVELLEAFLKAQLLHTEEERTSATMLLSCVLPERNICLLRHFFDFLHSIAQRSSENKMDSNNLSVILAPNLLHSGDGTEKMNTNTEKRLKLQAAVVRCFIENAHSFGVLPASLQEKVPSMMGCEVGVRSPCRDEAEERDFHSGMKKKNRRSIGDVVSGALNKIKTNRTPTHVTQTESVVFSSATPVIATPSSKRKLPFEPGHSFGFSNKKRRSVKKNLGIELLPNAFFSGTPTLGSANKSSDNILSSAGGSRRQSASSTRRKSKRLANRHFISRVESGKAGCFSPKASKKEVPRKSLRLRFSLGRNSKDAGSESIGWRLATQESMSSFSFTKELPPSVLSRKTESKCSKFISKSEDNLLTPQRDSVARQSSWSEETPVGDRAFGGRSFTGSPLNPGLRSNYTSEPAMITPRSPTGIGLSVKLCCASSAESLDSFTDETPRRGEEKEAGSGDGKSDTETDDAVKPSDIASTPLLTPPPKDSSAFPTQQRFLLTNQSITFSEMDLLTPLHIDSVVLESSSHADGEDAHCRSADVSAVEEQVAEQVNGSRLISALDIQSPARFKQSVSSASPTTSRKSASGLKDRFSPLANEGIVVGPRDKTESLPEIKIGAENPPSSPRDQEAENSRVAEHIQHFNRLTLYSPTGSKSKQIKSPLKFQRTPVRQTVRRINSLLGDARRPGRNTERSPRQSVAKAVSLESGLTPLPRRRPSNRTAKNPPPVPPKRTNTLIRKANSCALGDMTNKVQPKNSDGSDLSGLKPPTERDVSYYRGSPRNPMSQGRLMSATKPFDF